MEEAFCVCIGAYSNTFDSCYVDNTGKNSDFNFCLEVRDGSHDNTFKNIRCVAKTGCVGFFDRNNEGSGLEEQTNNTFTNCSFKGGEISITMQNAKNNTFTNCNIINSTYLFRFQGTNSTNADDNLGNTLRNCIVSGVPTTYDTRALTSSGWTPNQYNDMSSVSATYTDFFNGFAALPGTGNIAVDPLFADKTNSDFHLKSKYGRWNGKTWVKDGITSLCINAGDPQDAYSNEPFPNGNRINIGAYGNTAEASLNPKSKK
jgi:parallel beta-helix repeat protein